MSKSSSKGGRLSKGHREKMDRARFHRNSAVMMKCIGFLGWALIVAATWIPLQAMQPMIHEVAGKSTEFRGALSVSFAANLLIGGAFFAYWLKMKSVSRELNRVRSRSEKRDKQVVAQGAAAAPALGEATG